MLQNMKNHEDQYQSSTVVKALDILKAIGAREMNASEICQELSLNKTTAHRLLLTLQNENFIERNEATRKYRIGLSVLELCCSRLSDIELVTETRPFLIDLANAIQKPTHLGIYSSGNVVYVDKIEVLPKITMYSQIGKSIPIHCSSLGKALLLNHTDNEILNILGQYGMQAYTQHTITDPSVYLKQIAQGRRNGYTIDFCEHEDGMCCIASPQPSAPPVTARRSFRILIFSAKPHPICASMRKRFQDGWAGIKTYGAATAPDLLLLKYFRQIKTPLHTA